MHKINKLFCKRLIKACLMLGFMLVIGSAAAHPLHLSITNISIEDNQGTIVIKVFADDFNEVIQHNAAHNSLVDTAFGAMLVNYVTHHFKLWHGKKQVTLNYMAHHKADLSYYITFSFKWHPKYSQMSIENALFANWFFDQKNIVIVSYGSIEKGLEFTANKTQALVDFFEH